MKKQNLFQRSWLHLKLTPLKTGELGQGLGGFGRKLIHNDDI